MPIITILIPTYRRPEDLKRCLESLQQQTRPADEILIVVRNTDTETWHSLEKFDYFPLPLRILKVTLPGQVAALNAGLEAATGDIIAITDDDAAPHKEWAARIESHFLRDETVGGVGGRDWMFVDGQLQDASLHPGASNVVGKIQWFGRIIGNHHIGNGEVQEVEILKGANMSYRKTAIENLRFDENLKGAGAQVHNDLAFSLAVNRRGWKLIYDPSVAVNHYLSHRLDEDQRSAIFNYTACFNASHNETFILLKNLSLAQSLIFLSWSILIGTRSNFGLINFLRFLPKEKTVAFQKFVASLQGRWQGWQTWWQCFH